MYSCPNCKQILYIDKNKNKFLQCINVNCNSNLKKFPIYNNVPFLIPYGNKYCIFQESEKKFFQNLGIKKRNYSSKNEKLKRDLRNFFMGKNSITEKNFRYLLGNLESKSKVLIVGGGSIGSGSEYFFSQCKKMRINISSIDIYLSDNVSAIADAHYLPFESETFELVIIQAVLEHVINPNKVVNEIFRVLKKGGIIYSETPFMQCIHEGPFDFNRYSHSGHRWLLKRFEEIYSGNVGGAFTSSLFIISYSLSGLFRIRQIGLILRIIFSRICKVLDHLNDPKSNFDIACGFYFIGKKTEKLIEEELDIVKYYKGSQS